MTIDSGSRLPRVNDRRRWLEADDLLLRQLIERREPPARIARQMQRTRDAIRGRAGQLGLTVPSPLRPWHKHWTRERRNQRDCHIDQPKVVPNATLPEDEGHTPDTAEMKDRE